MSRYRIWVIEYARAERYPIGGVLYGAHNEGTTVLPYCYVAIVADDRKIMVDTGFSYDGYGQVLAEAYGITNWASPVATLETIGLTPDEIDTVVITHNHFDHIGNIKAFANATVHVRRREIMVWIEALAAPTAFAWLRTGTDPADLFQLLEVGQEGRLRLLEDGDVSIAPGILLDAAFDTHTAGSQYVTVDNGDGDVWVLAGDNVYVYENLEGRLGNGEMVPIGMASGSQTRSLQVMGEMVGKTNGETNRVVPVHANEIWRRFPTQVNAMGLHVAEITGASRPKH